MIFSLRTKILSWIILILSGKDYYVCVELKKDEVLNVLFTLGVVRKDYSEWSLESDFV